MQYKYINEENLKYIDSPVEYILNNRNIKSEDQYQWLNAGFESIEPWTKLNNMEKAVDVLYKVMQNHEDILIIVDADADGFSSAAILMNYIFNVDVVYADHHVHYFMHKEKEHGLADYCEYLEKEEIKPPAASNVTTIFCPDAATNDHDQMILLHDKYDIKNIVILDHHEGQAAQLDYVITVNNQLSDDYWNKGLSGAGVTWQFCRCYDEKFKYNYANKFIDLAALGILSDVMPFNNVENKAIIDIGLKNIQNPFFKGMAEKNSFSMEKKGGCTFNGVAWYVTPFINACVRSGTLEERFLIFDAMLEINANELIASNKRGHKGEQVPLWEEAVRVAANVKARQNKEQDLSMMFLEDSIKEDKLTDNNFILCLCAPGEISPAIAGLAATKIANEYQRPALVLTYDKETNCYRGSGRNNSYSSINNLREIIEESNLVEFAQGHSSAFGCSIPVENVPDFIKYLNQKLEGVSHEPTYYVDYIWTMYDIDNVAMLTILTIANMKQCWGQGVSEPYICIEDIDLSRCSVQLMGAKKNTVKIVLPCGVEIIRFFTDEDFYNELIKPNKILTVIGTCSVNEWNGNCKPQILLEDYELREEWIF